MAQHKYKLLDEGRISKPEETLSTFIEESCRKQRENKNLFWKIMRNYDKPLKKQASSIKTIEGHLGRITEINYGREVGSLPSFTETNPRGLAHAITTRSGHNYNPPKNPLEEINDTQNKTSENISTKKEMSLTQKISFEVGDETITFDIEKSLRFPPSDNDTCHSIDIIDLSILDHVQEILPSEPFDSFLFEPINHHLPTKMNSLWDDNKGEQDLINQILRDLEPKSEGYTKPTLFAANMFEEEKPTTKLKDLPSHLEYAFLVNN
ncbi:hypothetical protein Tco_0707999 [Tanacetum coccineum]